VSWTRERARVAALTRHHARPVEIEAARRDLRAARLELEVQRIVGEAPPLTEDQRRRLARVLAGAAVEGAT